MDLSFSKEQLEFQQEVRTWIAQALPERLAEKARTGAQFDHDDTMAWHRILHEKGYVAPDWPTEHGGTGWDLTRRHLFNEELVMAGTPKLSAFGLSMLAPLLLGYGTEEQKQRFLPKILSGEETWCQGYSEPNAGSDLASLQLKAESDGDHYILNGQKTWTSEGHHADWIFCLVRTDGSGKKQEGITFLLVDIKNTPGVEMKPFMNISGQSTFSDTYFDDARVPKSNVVGEEGGGWTVAKSLLGHERTLLAAVPDSQRAILQIKNIARNTKVGGRRLLDDPDFRVRLSRLEIRHKALEMTNLRALANMEGGKPGAEASILKIRGSEVLQEAHELALFALGHNALGWIDSGDDALPMEQQFVASQFNFSRAATIYGGSNEIQRNIVAKLILGLPTGR